MRDSVDVDGQFTHTSIHANAKERRIIDSLAPRKIVPNEVHEDLNFGNAFDASAVNLEVNEGRRDDVRNDCGAVIGGAKQLKCRKVRKWNGGEKFSWSIVQGKGLFEDGLVNEVEVLQTRHGLKCG